jgi:hypothetical protein
MKQVMLLAILVAMSAACATPNDERRASGALDDSLDEFETSTAETALSLLPCHEPDSSCTGHEISRVNRACGEQTCSDRPCGKSGDHTVLEQPHEYTIVLRTGNVDCVTYAPAPPGNAGCKCGL